MSRSRARRGHPAGAVAGTYGISLRSVPSRSDLLPGPQQTVLLLGAGRVAIGAGFLAFPVFSTKVLGLDSATAKRVTFLARMAASRDMALGAGNLIARDSPSVVAWLVAGAACDIADAGALAAALRKGVARGAAPVAIAVGALAAAALGLRAAAALSDRTRR